MSILSSVLVLILLVKDLFQLAFLVAAKQDHGHLVNPEEDPKVNNVDH